MGEEMKNCGGCWYWQDTEGCNILACTLTGLITYRHHGESCKAHRPRELGEPCGVWVEVPKANKNGTCNLHCDFWYDIEAVDCDCTKGWMSSAGRFYDGKPGPGCPRWKGEGNG